MDDRKLMQFYFITTAQEATHYHQDPELFYVLRGTLTITIDDQMYVMRQGDIILVNANKRHKVIGDENLLGARFVIDFHLLSKYMGSMQLLFWCNTVVDQNEAYGTLRSLLDQILTRWFEKDDNAALHLNALYYETVYVLTGNFLLKPDDRGLHPVSDEDWSRVRQIQNYIQANYQDRISLNDLSKKLYLSEAYLSKYIKKYTGLSFIEYLNNIRLFHAIDELMYSDKNLTHIALDNGFSSSASFTRAFQKVYHEAPSEYRKKFRTSQTVTTEYERNLETEGRILEYLKFREQSRQGSQNEIFSFADDGKPQGRYFSCSRFMNVGNAYSLLQSEVQQQILMLKNEIVVQYVRIWNLFPQQNKQKKGTVFSFQKLDRVLDFLQENGLKPYLELCGKPEQLIYTPKRAVKLYEQEWENLDIDVFSEYVRKFVAHLINRYGVEEVETWYFSMWCNPVLHIEKKDGEYYRYFDATYQVLKSFSPSIRFGGAGFVYGYDNDNLQNIASIWKERFIHPDFLSFCSYQYSVMEDGGIKYGRKSIDADYMYNQTLFVQQILKEADFYVPEFHIEEWNMSVSNRNVIQDSCEQGAYILKNCIDMNGLTDAMVYWHGMDFNSDYVDNNAVLSGDSGLISQDGIRKPGFYAFQFLNRLLPDVLSKDKNSIITTNHKGRIVIACHNYKRLAPRYVFTDEDKILPQEIDQYIENSDPLMEKFRISHVPDGTYRVKTYYVNRHNGSVMDLWKKLEFSRNLTKDEISYLKNSAIPAMEIQMIEAKQGVLELEAHLEEEEIRLIEVQYCYVSGE